MCVYACAAAVHMWRSEGVSSFPLHRRIQGSNSGHQAYAQVPMPTKPQNLHSLLSMTVWFHMDVSHYIVAAHIQSICKAIKEARKPVIRTGFIHWRLQCDHKPHMSSKLVILSIQGEKIVSRNSSNPSEKRCYINPSDYSCYYTTQIELPSLGDCLIANFPDSSW